MNITNIVDIFLKTSYFFSFFNVWLQYDILHNHNYNGEVALFSINVFKK